VLGLIVQQWGAGGVHDTVAALVRDRAYRRSIVGSLIIRALMAVVDGINHLIKAFEQIPGGRTTVIVVVVVLVALIAGRVVLTAQLEGGELTRRRRRGPQPVRPDAWAEAERLATTGDYTGAAHALYQAVLRRLAGTERIRLHASKTSGEYSRELRRSGSPSAAPFQRFGRRFDRVVFGIGECSPEEFEAMLREALAITMRPAS
jgi:Domain of unknown function (DUF4129)